MLITWMAGAILLGVALQFREKPPTPPSLSACEKDWAAAAVKQVKQRRAAETAARRLESSGSLASIGGASSAGAEGERRATALRQLCGRCRSGFFHTVCRRRRVRAVAAPSGMTPRPASPIPLALPAQVVAFAIATAVSDMISTFLEAILHSLRATRQTIGYAGASFQSSVLLGSILVGHYIDRTKQYANGIQACFLASCLGLFCAVGATRRRFGRRG